MSMPCIFHTHPPISRYATSRLITLLGVEHGPDRLERVASSMPNTASQFGVINGSPTLVVVLFLGRWVVFVLTGPPFWYAHVGVEYSRHTGCCCVTPTVSFSVAGYWG